MSLQQIFATDIASLAAIGPTQLSTGAPTWLSTSQIGINMTPVNGGSSYTTQTSQLQINAGSNANGTSALFINSGLTNYAGLNILVGGPNASGTANSFDITCRPSYSAGVATGGDVSMIYISNPYPTNTPNLSLVRNGGNVGVGTTNPLSLFHVAGQMQIDSGAYGRIMFSQSGTNIWSVGPRTTTDLYLYPENANTGNVIVAGSTTLGIGIANPGGGIQLNNYTTSWNPTSTTIYPFPAGNVFLHQPAIRNQDNWFGISSLNNYGATTGSANLLLAATNNNTNQQAGNYIGSQVVSTTQSDLTFGTIIGGSSVTTAGSKSEQMRLTSGGYLGIGTTSPNKILTTSSSAQFGGGSYSGHASTLNGTSFAFNRDVDNGYIFSSGGYAYQWQHTASTTNTSDYLSLQVYNPSGTNITTQAISINGAGNVGIGTQAPSYPLDVNGSIRAGGSLASAIPIMYNPGMYTYAYGSGPSYANTPVKIGNIGLSGGNWLSGRIIRSGDYNYAGNKSVIEFMMTVYLSTNYNFVARELMNTSSGETSYFAIMSNGDIYYYHDQLWQQFLYIEIYSSSGFTYSGALAQDYQTVTRPWKSISNGALLQLNSQVWGT
jgi:hypothetical protein